MGLAVEVAVLGHPAGAAATKVASRRVAFIMLA
jgi:hypothetical protein